MCEAKKVGSKGILQETCRLKSAWPAGRSARLGIGSLDLNTIWAIVHCAFEPSTCPIHRVGASRLFKRKVSEWKAAAVEASVHETDCSRREDPARGALGTAGCPQIGWKWGGMGRRQLYTPMWFPNNSRLTHELLKGEPPPMQLSSNLQKPTNRMCWF